jgi:hypothetical protein
LIELASFYDPDDSRQDEGAFGRAHCAHDVNGADRKVYHRNPDKLLSADDRAAEGVNAH